MLYFEPMKMRQKTKHRQESIMFRSFVKLPLVCCFPWSYDRSLRDFEAFCGQPYDFDKKNDVCYNPPN